MSHDYHQGPDDAVLYDDCQECDERAADPTAGLLNLDTGNFERLWSRVQAVEYSGTDHYRSGNEAKLGRALYHAQMLFDRHGRLA